MADTKGSKKTTPVTLAPLPGHMDTLAPDGGVRGQTARLIVNLRDGVRFGGFRLFGWDEPCGYVNQALHDQLLGAQCAGTIVVETAPAITRQPVSKTVNETASTYFYVSATGGNLTYQWYKAGVLIPGEVTATLNFPHAHLFDEGTYWVVVANGHGSVQSVTAHLIVIPLPVDPSTEPVAVEYYNGIEELRAINPIANQQTARLRFLHFENDNQGGWFDFVDYSMAPDDNTDVARPNHILATNPGRWIRSGSA